MKPGSQPGFMLFGNGARVREAERRCGDAERGCGDAERGCGRGARSGGAGRGAEVRGAERPGGWAERGKVVVDTAKWVTHTFNSDVQKDATSEGV